MKDTYCIDEYSGDNVNIDGKSPWLVSTYTKTKVGYEESFCVWCAINNMNLHGGDATVNIECINPYNDNGVHKLL